LGMFRSSNFRFNFENVSLISNFRVNVDGLRLIDLSCVIGMSPYSPFYI
jgi:hypothetical protein